MLLRPPWGLPADDGFSPVTREFGHFVRKNGIELMQSARRARLGATQAIAATHMRSHKFAAIYQIKVGNQAIIFADLENIVY